MSLHYSTGYSCTVWDQTTQFVLGFLIIFSISYTENGISGVMVSMLALSAIDRGFEPRSGQTKDYKIDICCFSS